MAEVKILIEGYAKNEGSFQLASCTTTLIKEKNINIIVDPGMNRMLLLKSLEKENLSVDSINYIILTHHHLDHILLSGIFNKAKILDDEYIYHFDGKIEKHNNRVPGTNIEIIKTPGHQSSHCSVLVNDEKLRKVVIAADVFWWWDNEDKKIDKKSLMNREDPYAENNEELIKSREKLLEIADYVIPGHGNMFKVKK